jgi:hypothetical protein
MAYEHPSDDFWNEDAAALLARCVFGEARSERDEGRRAVAWVVRNRSTQKNRTFQEVILQRAAFSCFLHGDPNYPKLKDPEHSDPQAWAGCLAVANTVACDPGYASNPIDGATHYYAGRPPPWAGEGTVVKVIGGHTFLKGIPYTVPSHAYFAAAVGGRSDVIEGASRAAVAAFDVLERGGRHLSPPIRARLRSAGRRAAPAVADAIEERIAKPRRPIRGAKPRRKATGRRTSVATTKRVGGGPAPGKRGRKS